MTLLDTGLLPEKIYQDKFGIPDGNCFEACVASILGIKLNDIPAFRASNWYEEFRGFLKKYNLDALYFAPENAKEYYESYPIPEVIAIASGQSPRGILHSVVFYGKSLIHDPHPDGGGIELPPKDWIFLMPRIVKIIPINPVELVEVDEKKLLEVIAKFLQPNARGLYEVYNLNVVKLCSFLTQSKSKWLKEKR